MTRWWWDGPPTGTSRHRALAGVSLHRRAFGPRGREPLKCPASVGRSWSRWWRPPTGPANGSWLPPSMPATSARSSFTPGWALSKWGGCRALGTNGGNGSAWSSCSSTCRGPSDEPGRGVAAAAPVHGTACACVAPGEGSSLQHPAPKADVLQLNYPGIAPRRTAGQRAIDRWPRPARLASRPATAPRPGRPRPDRSGTRGPHRPGPRGRRRPGRRRPCRRRWAAGAG